MSYPQEFIDESVLQGRTLTRFPPEPNGHLHLGHVKSMCVNFGFAEHMKGHCIMRFDDTNPSAEKTEYFDSILEDLEWMHCKKALVTYSSDYFRLLFLYAIRLIEQGNAYVCELTGDDVSLHRDSKTESPFKDRPIGENIRLFHEMRDGKHPENSLTLRMKGDLTNPNPNLWDPIMYRIINKPHPRTGTEWCIYPTYDYSHGIIDSLEGITHSFCTKEFEVRREQYYWFIDKLGLRRPYVYEFARLNIDDRTLSKRKLKEMVDTGIVSGWDDPRLLTIKGLKRRGFTPSALTTFCNNIGINKTDSVISFELLEHYQRTEFEPTIPRRMAVLNPLKLIITNMPDEIIVCSLPDFPFLKTSPGRLVSLTKTVYIEQESFRDVDSKDYYGLAPKKTIRLRYGPFLEYVSHDTENVFVKIVEPENPKKIKGILNWVSDSAITINVRHFNNLTVTEKKSLAEVSLSHVKPFDRFQFERHGYYCVDYETNVFNEIVSLKSSFKP